MIAVVTGSSGFLGSHLVDALVARGMTVRALVRPETRAPRDPRVSYWEADLLDDRSVRESRVWDGATQVYHLAGITRARTEAQFRAGNAVPTANVLAAIAAREGPPPRIVLVSSQAAGGPSRSADMPTREEDPPAPVEAYGRSKLFAEQAVLRHAGRLPVSIVRPAAIYGPRDRDFLAAFRQASRRVAIHGAPPSQSFSIAHVHDVVQALLLAAERPEAVGRTYLVANDQPITWRALYEKIGRAAGTDPLQLAIPLPLLGVLAIGADAIAALRGRPAGLLNRNKVALARPAAWVCDSSRIRQELGWNPSVPLQQGVRETYLWYRDAGWLGTPASQTIAASQSDETA